MVWIPHIINGMQHFITGSLYSTCSTWKQTYIKLMFTLTSSVLVNRPDVLSISNTVHIKSSVCTYIHFCIDCSTCKKKYIYIYIVVWLLGRFCSKKKTAASPPASHWECELLHNGILTWSIQMVSDMKCQYLCIFTIKSHFHDVKCAMEYVYSMK